MSQEIPVEEKPFFCLKAPIGEREYEFRCPPESPISEVYAALGEMRKWCEDQAKSADKKEPEQKEEAAPEAAEVEAEPSVDYLQPQ